MVRFYHYNIPTYACGDSLTTIGLSEFTNENAIAATASQRRCSSYIYENPAALDPGEFLDFEIGRNGTSVNDTLLDDIVILGVEIRYTADM